jgi:N-methylhydantoinase A/oxoprolinase/acetone carboxylase beta subunit
VDTGGTFTDIVGTDKWGKVIAAKALTTPPNSEEGVMKAISVLGGGSLG